MLHDSFLHFLAYYLLNTIDPCFVFSELLSILVPFILGLEVVLSHLLEVVTQVVLSVASLFQLLAQFSQFLLVNHFSKQNN